MELNNALLCYLGIAILFFLIFLRLGIYPVPSLVLSLLIGQIALLILAPPYALDPIQRTDSSSALYVVIQIVTPVIIIIYVFISAFENRKRNICHL